MSIELIVFIIILIVFMWFISAWSVLTQLTGGRVRRIESSDKELAKQLDKWLEKRDDYNITFRMLLFLMISILGTLGATITKNLFENIELTTVVSVEIALGLLFIVIIGELFAKLILFKINILVLRLTLPIVHLLGATILAPFIISINFFERRIEDWEQKNEGEEDKVTFEDEIMSIIESDDDEEEEDKDIGEEKRMIKGIFDLDDTPVREIMTPRVDVRALSLTDSIENAKKMIVETGHSRVPIYDEVIDNIKGVIFAKDFLDDELVKGKTLSQLAHAPVFIPETKTVGPLLEELKEGNSHFAVIIDEYGGTSGIITLEDIIEEIVGEIRDEYDEEEEGEELPRMLSDGSAIVEGRMIIDEVNELLDIEIPEDEDVDTIGGYVCARLGKIPEIGEKVILHENILAAVLTADKRKILTLKLTLLDKSNE
jgi:CBS domain containing-hemolysin-like protein